MSTLFSCPLREKACTYVCIRGRFLLQRLLQFLALEVEWVVVCADSQLHFALFLWLWFGSLSRDPVLSGIRCFFGWDLFGFWLVSGLCLVFEVVAKFGSEGKKKPDTGKGYFTTCSWCCKRRIMKCCVEDWNLGWWGLRIIGSEWRVEVKGLSSVVRLVLVEDSKGWNLLSLLAFTRWWYLRQFSIWVFEFCLDLNGFWLVKGDKNKKNDILE